jgi:hypothetical protein
MLRFGSVREPELPARKHQTTPRVNKNSLQVAQYSRLRINQMIGQHCREAVSNQTASTPDSPSVWSDPRRTLQ